MCREVCKRMLSEPQNCREGRMKRLSRDGWIEQKADSVQVYPAGRQIGRSTMEIQASNVDASFYLSVQFVHLSLKVVHDCQ